jgi:DNA replication and repair protein RecF
LYVSHLVLHDFRSYVDVEVVLDPGATAFIGSNGQGKTNLIEAIDYLSRLSRTAWPPTRRWSAPVPTRR